MESSPRRASRRSRRRSGADPTGAVQPAPPGPVPVERTCQDRRTAASRSRKGPGRRGRRRAYNGCHGPTADHRRRAAVPARPRHQPQGVGLRRLLGPQRRAGPGSPLEARHPDLVLLDLGLPGMDGMAVLAAMRRWSQVPILVLTARNGGSDAAVRPRRRSRRLPGQAVRHRRAAGPHPGPAPPHRRRPSALSPSSPTHFELDPAERQARVGGRAGPPHRHRVAPPGRPGGGRRRRGRLARPAHAGVGRVLHRPARLRAGLRGRTAPQARTRSRPDRATCSPVGASATASPDIPSPRIRSIPPTRSRRPRRRTPERSLVSR